MPKNDSGNEGKSKLADMKLKDLVILAEEQEEQLTKKDEEISTLKAELGKVNGVLADDLKARKTKQIMDVSIYTIEDLDGKTVEELDDIISTLRCAKRVAKPVTDMPSNTPQTPNLDLFGTWRKNKVT
jgi:hypothetical protein